jgi:branched-subunit amino acid ABC-type transport system permease component
MEMLLNPLALLANFVLVPGLAYGSQLALGALGVTMVYAVLNFSNFSHGEVMSFGAMITILQPIGYNLSACRFHHCQRPFWHYPWAFLAQLDFASYWTGWCFVFIAINGPVQSPI